ncbi:hypothetical protein MN608_00459 [Microdochium nivale]|nr:hypothetical protein MN608_00459 [Microdochium nivale]
MIQQQSWRPLCRSVACSSHPHTTLLPQSQKRHAHWRPRWPRTVQKPTRTNRPVFDAPLLLIDLDAEDCTAVRPHDEVLDGIPSPKAKPRVFELKAINKRINAFNKRASRWEASFAEVRGDVFSPWRISAFDALAALLLGSRTDTPQLAQQPGKADKFATQLFTTLARNGVQLGGVREDLSSLTKYMLRRQQLAWRTTAELGDEFGFREALNSASEALELERIVTNTMQTSAGRALVLADSQLVADKCFGFVRMLNQDQTEQSFRERNGHVLCFVNNLIINFRHHGMAESIHLSSLADMLARKGGVRLAPADPIEGPLATEGHATTHMRADAHERHRAPPGSLPQQRAASPPGFRDGLTPMWYPSKADAQRPRSHDASVGS